MQEAERLPGTNEATEAQSGDEIEGRCGTGGRCPVKCWLLLHGFTQIFSFRGQATLCLMNEQHAFGNSSRSKFLDFG